MPPVLLYFSVVSQLDTREKEALEYSQAGQDDKHEATQEDEFRSEEQMSCVGARGPRDTMPLGVWSVVCSFNGCNTRIPAARREEDRRQVHSPSCRVGRMLSGSLSG